MVNDIATHPGAKASHHIVRAFRQDGEAEAVRQLACHLHPLCERLAQAEDARPYNEVIFSRSSIESAATHKKPPVQVDLLNLE